VSAGLGGVLLGVLVFVYCKYKRGSWLAGKNRTRRDYHAVTKGFPLKFEIAEWNVCQIVTFNVLNDLNKVVNEFPSISTLFMV
jgi:hypothetical protein